MPPSSAHLSAASAHRPGWVNALVARARLLFWLKTVGITAFIWLFFIGYFWVLRHPAHDITLMPLTALDHLVSFQPVALIPYLTLWLYVGFAPGLAQSFRHLVIYGLWASALCVTGLLIFYLWPTAVPPPPPEAILYPGFALLQGVDAPGNACPSMHVAVAVFSALCLNRLLTGIGAPGWLKVINTAWCVAIAYSTLATKQHVALDAVAGTLLGTAFAVFSLHGRPGGWRAEELARGATDIIRAQ